MRSKAIEVQSETTLAPESNHPARVSSSGLPGYDPLCFEPIDWRTSDAGQRVHHAPHRETGPSRIDGIAVHG
uniref:Uncharacterized protein n=1 Tax=Candidatus Kentrum sp. TC TaxID=2126339 RepID=A0A450YVI2_9GAMM|nr:MAG: hypothetical protein BECKTC1821E_GA0114239_10515 [Candidatus Kentron sp. TC]